LTQREQNIEIADYQDDEILFNIAPRNTTIEQPFVTVCENFSMNQTNWQRASYSSMALKAENVRSKEVFGSGNEYDRFVFSELKKGKEIGNMLHFILERINFSDGGKWDKVVTEALEKYAFDKKEAWYSSVCQMIHEVLNAQIEIDGSTFRLSELQNNKRLHEMEFDFTVPLFEPQMLNELTDDRISVRIKSSENLEGLINGKLDMFFEHGGKYYILDWKSNFLGLTLDDYNSDNLLVAMNDNNYHLQYLLYTCAIDKYLNARLKNDYDYDTHFGGVIYCFLRGMRQSSTNAIYTFKPPLNLLNKMRSIMRLE
jgi:exodeoxyribonuclease V beta subunit